jgi:sugar lactone lactonase YvrE/predicted esterase
MKQPLSRVGGWVLLVMLSVTAAVGTAASQASQTSAALQKGKKKASAWPPDATTQARLKERLEQLRQAVAELQQRGVAEDVWIEVALYAQAVAKNLRWEEWLHPNSVRWAEEVLEEGWQRAAAARQGQAPWRSTPGRWSVRAYRSRIDGSIQPYAVLLPAQFDLSQGGPWRLDIVLHGRDASLTETKFLAQHSGRVAVASPPDYIQLEVYGRGNNAYRWAGETDVFEALEALLRWAGARVDRQQVVLRGFSMGGAATWHIGLHYPCRFRVLGPGAGFTTTQGYVANLPDPLPDYQEKCLRIYDAVRYAENAYLVPIVAYSGAKDPQKAAADNIVDALRDFPWPVRLTHLVAPDLGHQMPPQWHDKAQAEYRRYLQQPPLTARDHLRFVTYTTRYHRCGPIEIMGLHQHYQKAVVDWRQTGEKLVVQTSNVRRLRLHLPSSQQATTVILDGRSFRVPAGKSVAQWLQQAGRWQWFHEGEDAANSTSLLEKRPGLQGPIDDAFCERFHVVGPQTDEGWPAAQWQSFTRLWERGFRGELPRVTAAAYTPQQHIGHLVLFGTPQSNPWIARLLPHCPIVWNDRELIVNAVRYDARHHVPVMIFPHPEQADRYVVLNSGHTFSEADLRGTNALLYPRWGDWAVLRIDPSPHAAGSAPSATVVAAGLFDEYWQFTGPVAEGAQLEKLWSEGSFTEGPTEGPDGCIYFSDIGNRLMKYDPRTGKTTVFREPSGRSNGLKFDAQGRLIACEGANTGGGRRLSITDKDGTVRTLADRYQSRRFNSPNDLTLDRHGRIYFSDPRYVGEEPRELDHESVYRVDPDGTVTRLTFDTVKPNGLVLSPDEQTLYVAEHSDRPDGPHLLLAYPIRKDGTLGPRRVLYDFGRQRGIDGMTITRDGIIIAAAGQGEQGGIYFFSPEGKKLAFLPTPETPSNCCLAGSDRLWLYITAGKSLYRIRLAR